ncbi:MAG: hypothetical protein DLM73_06515 [Chthoniobacterales bacterium]|nr:MAG: hypothetical protein DLM73_06515 [Chthoniobacterales bacterium]
MSVACSKSIPVYFACVLIAFIAVAPSANARKKDPAFATSANDPVLWGRIAALAPSVNPEEAQRVAQIAYTTGRDLKREWRVVWPPGLQNFLVNTGQRKGGLCFQWAEGLLLRLTESKWETLEFHWAESFQTTASEHNVIVVTAKGQPFWQGIILDNWRYGGRLVWGFVTEDPHYNWHENQAQFRYVLSKRPSAAPSSRVAPNSKPSASVPERQAR